MLVFGVAIVLVIATLAPQYGWFKRKDFAGEGNGTSVSFTVNEGDPIGVIAANLEEAGVIADAGRFVETYSKEAAKKFIQPGEYEMQQEMSSSAAISELVGEQNANSVYIALQRNLRADEAYQVIADAAGVDVSEVSRYDKERSRFGIPEKFPSLEGWIHPGEYRFEEGTTVEEILQSLVDRTRSELEKAGITGDEEIFHVLTVASILEFEALEQDYKAVAGAIENRLDNPEGETSGYLQSDATVAYGLGKKTYHITTAEKNDESNRYNTFYHKGLPVGPIGSPGSLSIEAASNPEDNDYYFWVTVDLNTGKTLFAETYEEHLKNVEVYEQWCSDNPGKCV
nr:endolytic transglycosylase MltG [Rothia sp. ZJ1223]